MASEIKVNTIKRATGTTITLGESGDTVALACGATSTGFGITGITWCTTAKTAAFCAAAGSGYLVNTTSTAFTATLPASPTVGDQVSFVDFAGTFDSNALTLGRNSKKIKGSCCDATVDAERGAVTIIYTGTTQGWITTSQANAASMSQETFITATGGTITTDGDYKVHAITGTGPFNVTAIGCASNDQVEYMVVAGGGGGGFNRGSGGGGAGGFRTSATPATELAVTVQDYTLTIGAGGTGGSNPGPGSICATSGTASIFSTITSAGGGKGGKGEGGNTPLNDGGDGGSGGGAAVCGQPVPGSVGSGDTPPAPVSQGNDGGLASYGSSSEAGGGGGGAATAGGAGSQPRVGGTGGAGSPVAAIFGCAPKAFYIANGAGAGASVCGQFAGGGGGGSSQPADGTPGVGGVGGGGDGHGGPGNAGISGVTNTGGGGGGAGAGTPGDAGGNGGSGYVLVRYKFQ
jgi:hypothetical protein